MQQQYEQPWGQQQQQPHGYPPAQDAVYGGGMYPIITYHYERTH